MKGDFHDLREEILERVWNLTEDGDTGALQELTDYADRDALDAEVRHLTKTGLLTAGGPDLSLTDEGRRVARHVVRANRLASRLLTDLFEMSPSEAERQACRLEHAISEEVADGICTLLSHPPAGPDGRPIPRGRCCEVLSERASPVVRPLTDLELGQTGRITFIHARYPERLDQLSSLGMVPGTEVRLKQRQPAVVVEVDYTTLALDAEVAGEIFIKPV